MLRNYDELAVPWIRIESKEPTMAAYVVSVTRFHASLELQCLASNARAYSMMKGSTSIVFLRSDDSPSPSIRNPRVSQWQNPNTFLACVIFNNDFNAHIVVERNRIRLGAPFIFAAPED